MQASKPWRLSSSIAHAAEDQGSEKYGEPFLFQNPSILI